MHTNAHTPSLAFSEKVNKFRNGWETTQNTPWLQVIMEHNKNRVEIQEKTSLTHRSESYEKCTSSSREHTDQGDLN